MGSEMCIRDRDYDEACGNSTELADVVSYLPVPDSCLNFSSSCFYHVVDAVGLVFI